MAGNKPPRWAVWAVALVVFFLLGQLILSMPGNQSGERQIIFSEFVTWAAEGKVAEVTVSGGRVRGKFSSGERFSTYIPPNDREIISLLRQKNARIIVKPPENNSWLGIISWWLPLLIFLGIFLWFMRRTSAGVNSAQGFSKSPHKLYQHHGTPVVFADVGGADEAKEELREIVEFLRDPTKFQRLGGKIPKGILLVGPTGTGKTLLARAVAGEAGVPFFSISGSSFVEMFVGVGAARVRDLFEEAKKKAPCIIFMDEIDAVGRQRGAGIGGGHDEREQTLNQILVEMDGFETERGVIILAATNRPDILDPALLRPGRFDRQVVVPLPDLRGREAILRVCAQKIPLDPDVDFSILARGTPGFSGADLANMVNEATLSAARRNGESVGKEDFEYAKDKVVMGVERKSVLISEEERRNTACHEAGHTIMVKALPGTDPVHKVTIIPRGRALGLTQQLPLDDRYNYSKEYLFNRIVILLGGRAAEQEVLGTVTTGAADDLEKATEVSRKMVCSWGMSELGPRTFGRNEELIFLGREINRTRDYSETAAKLIDEEVGAIIGAALAKARAIVQQKKEILQKLLEALLRQETLTGEEVDRIWNAHPSGPTE